MSEDRMELRGETKAILMILKEVRDMKPVYKNNINTILTKIGAGDANKGFQRMVANLEARPEDVNDILIVMHDAIVEHTDIVEDKDANYEEVVGLLDEEGLNSNDPDEDIVNDEEFQEALERGGVDGLGNNSDREDIEKSD